MTYNAGKTLFYCFYFSFFDNFGEHLSVGSFDDYDGCDVVFLDSDTRLQTGLAFLTLFSLSSTKLSH